MCVDGIEYNFKGTIALVPGDNLASQFLGGYKALNAALRKCRHCMATVEDMNSKVSYILLITVTILKTFYLTMQFVAESFQSRTRETHQHQCSTLTGSLQQHNSIAFGIRHDSILNQSSYFHVTEGLCPDIMHDVLEGSLAYEIKELIRHLILSKVITLECLNDSLSKFPYYGADACNKPSPLGKNVITSADHGLKQSGKQIYLN